MLACLVVAPWIHACISKGDTYVGDSERAARESSDDDTTPSDEPALKPPADDDSALEPEPAGPGEPTEVPSPAHPSSSLRGLATGSAHTCGIDDDAGLVCWGNQFGETPAGTGFKEVAVGASTACAIRTDNSLVCWGTFTFGEEEPPEGAFDSVSVGMDAACGLRTDGSVLCWGTGVAADEREPEGEFQSVAFLCGVTVSGEVSCWGNSPYAEVPSISEQVALVTVSQMNACALSVDGRAVCWGTDVAGVTEPPDEAFEHIDLGAVFGCGIRTSDMFVECWPPSSAPVPPPFVFATLTCGDAHCCGIRTNGAVACWGDSAGATEAPE